MVRSPEETTCNDQSSGGATRPAVTTTCTCSKDQTGGAANTTTTNLVAERTDLRRRDQIRSGSTGSTAERWDQRLDPRRSSTRPATSPPSNHLTPTTRRTPTTQPITRQPRPRRHSNHLDKELEENLAKLKQFVLEKLEKLPNDVRSIIENIELLSFISSRLRYRHPWELLFGNISKGNVCVAGDAFHPMTPDLGQGGCSALEDGVVLARCLGEAFSKELGTHLNEKDE